MARKSRRKGLILRGPTHSPGDLRPEEESCLADAAAAGVPPMKLTRVGFVLLAVMALTLLASATAVQGAKAPKAPHYKVLVVTAGDKNSAGEQGRRQGDQGDRQGRRHQERPEQQVLGRPRTGPAQIDDKFTAKHPRQVPRRHLPRHRGGCPAQRRAEGRVRGVLPRRRRLPRDRLGDRDRARLAVLHGPPRRAVCDDACCRIGSSRHQHQGRRHRRPRRRQDDLDRHRREQRVGDDP